MDYYFLPEPPYFLVFAGVFIGITCGLAFQATLKQKAQDWLKAPASQKIDQSALQFPFLGICLGICVFLASGFEIFLLDSWLAYAIALPTTIFIGSLVWLQLGQVLQQLKQGGSKALDLDAF
jgi:hypothetical protein